MFLVSYTCSFLPLFAGLHVHVLIATSSCFGRKTQEGKEREDASYAWQFPQARSRYLNSVASGVFFGWKKGVLEWGSVQLAGLASGLTSVLQILRLRHLLWSFYLFFWPARV